MSTIARKPVSQIVNRRDTPVWVIAPRQQLQNIYSSGWLHVCWVFFPVSHPADRRDETKMRSNGDNHYMKKYTWGEKSYFPPESQSEPPYSVMRANSLGIYRLRLVCSIKNETHLETLNHNGHSPSSSFRSIWWWFCFKVDDRRWLSASFSPFTLLP